MSVLHIRLRAATAQPVDMSGLTPELLAEVGLDAIATRQLRCGGQLRPVATLFELEREVGDSEQPRLEIHESTAMLDGIGGCMTAGRIVVHGHAGAFLGSGMSGGLIEVRGACGAFAASGMSGGDLRVDRDADDYLGAALPGERLGMRGGTVVIQGNAGARVGERMRGGLILVNGQAGASCAVRMIAGTVVARNGAEAGVGRGMRRGTVVLGVPSARLPRTFFDGGVHAPGFMSILSRELQRISADEPTLPLSAMRRWLGDRANAGLGEIFTPA